MKSKLLIRTSEAPNHQTQHYSPSQPLSFFSELTLPQPHWASICSLITSSYMRAHCPQETIFLISSSSWFLLMNQHSAQVFALAEAFAEHSLSSTHGHDCVTVFTAPITISDWPLFIYFLPVALTRIKLFESRNLVYFNYHCISSIYNSVSNSLSVQLSLSRVWPFATPWTAARQASLSITNSRILLKFMSIELVMPSNHLILCRPLLLLPSIFPSIRVFSNESVLCIRWPKYWSFIFNLCPSNEHSGLISFRMDELQNS